MHDFGFITAARTDDTLCLRGAMAGPHCLLIRRGPDSRFIGPAFRSSGAGEGGKQPATPTPESESTGEFDLVILASYL